MADYVPLRATYNTDSEGTTRLSVTRNYSTDDVTEETDAEGNKLNVSHTVDVTRIISSTNADEYNTTMTNDLINFGEVGVSSSTQVSYADKDKKAAMIAKIESATNEGELAIALQAVTDSYNSTKDNIGKKGYEEALRVAAAKKQSLEAGANDEAQAGNATNVNGNAHDHHDADSAGDNRTMDVVDGNSDKKNPSGVHDDTAESSVAMGQGGHGDENGEGHAGQGEGQGMGNGTGNGVNGGNVGDGGNSAIATSVGGGFNSNGTPIQTAPITQTENSKDAEAIASYLSKVNDDVPINHIFHNNFYQNDPVAHWSFSIDFIPSVKLQNSNVNLYACGQTLTKAVIAASVPDRNVKSTVSHYKGMTIELPARAKTAGTLSMRFAENEEFEVSTVLNQLYQFARSDTYFERIDNIIENLQTEAQIAQYTQLLRAYRHAIPDSGHLYNILVKVYKMKDAQAFSEDNESAPSFVYFFVGCDLQTVDKIDLDYDNDKPIDVSCVWLYQYFEELTFDEYKQRYGAGAQPVSTDYNPNGNVDAMLESMEGNPNAHKEAVEYSWNEDIKRDNLSSMANENWETLMELDAMEDLE